MTPSIPVDLPTLLALAGIDPESFAARGRPILSVTADSRQVRTGSLFVCMPSGRVDTHDYLASAAEAGASAALVHSLQGMDRARELGLDAAWLPHRGFDFNFGAALAAHVFHGRPSRELKVFGVTGTNGKTTTAWLVRDALAALGWAPAYLGTLGLDAGEGLREIPNTTPFPVELAGLMAEVRQAGCRSLAMEVSSHALVENRVAGVDFDAVVFTNLTQDHLDYHHTMEAYEEAKRLLFTAWRDSSLAAGKPWQGAVNIADPTGLRWSRDLGDRILTFGPAASGAGLAIDAVEVRADRIRLKVGFQGRTAESELKIGGLFNVENAGACLAGLICMGAPFEDAVLALESVRAVPGRFEAVPNDQGLAVIVDYAHTPDALVQLLRSARAVAEGRIITVFGCGGDRDRTKRPRMAEAAAQGSDLIFVTSDNPRTEDPEQILDDVVAGIPPGTESVREADRPTAIVQAIRAARPGDLVVIAGKGHENYQIIGRTKHPMDDRELARAGLALR